MNDTIKTELHFPDDLVCMWNSAHNVADGAALGSEEVADKWVAVQTMLCGYILKNRLPGIYCRQDALDAANDYLCHLLSGICPGNITSHSILIANMKRYLAWKRNPVQSEMVKILFAALRTLEKAGKIKRDENSIGRNISGRTWFSLSDCKNPGCAGRDDYERNRSKVPSYRTVIRANDPERSRIIPPKSARDLVLHLLDAFGGWTLSSDLLWAMQFHVPEQLKYVSPQADPDSLSELDPTENIPDAEAQNYIYEYDHEAVEMIAGETVRRIWDQVSKINDKLFCLYFLPQYLPDAIADAVLEDFGPHSTAADQNKRITKIMAEELSAYKFHSEVSIREQAAENAVLQKISSNLHQNCTEKGYIITLHKAETEEEE